VNNGRVTAQRCHLANEIISPATSFTITSFRNVSDGERFLGEQLTERVACGDMETINVVQDNNGKGRPL